MKKILLLAAMLIGSWGTAHSQLLLNEGQTLTHTFNTIPLIGQVFTPPPGEGQLGRFNLLINGGPATENSSLLVELFQDEISGTPAYSQMLDFPLGPNIQFRVSDLWDDLEGSMRMTMVSGEVTINSFFFEVELPTATPGLSDLYSSGTVVPIPEPSTWALGCVGLVLAGCVYYRRRAHRSTAASA